jgi:hypothetical protein
MCFKHSSIPVICFIVLWKYLQYEIANAFRIGTFLKGFWICLESVRPSHHSTFKQHEAPETLFNSLLLEPLKCYGLSCHEILSAKSGGLRVFEGVLGGWGSSQDLWFKWIPPALLHYNIYMTRQFRKFMFEGEGGPGLNWIELNWIGLSALNISAIFSRVRRYWEE